MRRLDFASSTLRWISSFTPSESLTFFTSREGVVESLEKAGFTLKKLVYDNMIYAKIEQEDAATKTVTVMMGQRIVSMTIGGRTMYINGTPVAMSTAPEITNDFTFVPVRDLANALGISKIDWNAEADTVTLN